MGLLRDKLKHLIENEASYIRNNQVRVRIIGNKSLIPPDILKDLEHAEKITDIPLSTKTLFVCFPYTSRDDIAHAVQLASQALPKDKINEQLLNDNMYMGPNCPQLDLLVRTSGHTRLSDFMLWQCSKNCHIEFTNTLWPDFKFLSLMLVLIKWSYYQQKRSEYKIKPQVDWAQQKAIDLASLPPPPPFASVAGK